MSKRARWACIAGALFALWALGLAEFPKAQDPGRAEAGGIDLPLRGIRLDIPGDWSLAESPKGIRATPGGVSIRLPGHESALISRWLAVFPHDCYALRVVARTRGGISAQVLDTSGNEVSRLVPLRRGSRETVATFTPGGRREVIILILSTGPRPHVTTISDAAITRLASGPCSAR